jgi:signal transduction histidine kinase
LKRKIFEPGFTLDPATGSGLGLYVVRKVVERYGGRVWVEDTKPKGATFVIRLKSKQAASD